jgi:acetyl-CoA acyltransferase
MQNPVYIIEAKRSAVTKAKKGGFSRFRPDELLANIIHTTVKSAAINPNDIDDVVIGCAFPEGKQGLNVARISLLLAGLPNSVPGITVNRYCSSGLNAIAIAANSIRSGECEVVLAGGVESMSLIPMGGNNLSLSPEIFTKDENIAIAYGMGITAENVASQWNIDRISQDEFALQSNQRAVDAIKNGYFKEQIIPIEVKHHVADEMQNKIITQKKLIDTDEGPHFDTSMEALAKLKPAFAMNGSVTAGNSSQMSDGASVLILVSEAYLKKHNLTPIAKFVEFAVSGIDPKIMGIGPLKAVPKVLEKSGLTLTDIDWIELNEAFAAQSLAVIKELKLDMNKVNPYGGAIALGHPLGATGAILATKIIHGMRHRAQKYGIVTMCIGNGMGAAGVFEMIY